MIKVLYLLFVLSGAAGLIYESIWTRYLGLFVGHDAYAQIIVLVIFLGGMSVGAIAISRWSERLKEPLYGYVAIEFLVGCIGLFFHEVFQGVTGWAYQGLYPALAGTWGLTVAKWAIAGSLILPQSVLLGMTFPLMTAGVLRLSGAKPGRTLSLLYFSNSLGAAAGVLVAGFYLVDLAGLPGTLLAAAMLNLLVAGSTIAVVVLARRAAPDLSGTAAKKPPEPMASPAGNRAGAKGLERLLLFTSLGTAVASFIYEIDWIRMLALVLGSATHSFELMLSAFILGLALGAWWIRSRADSLADPLRTLGLVQLTMGFLALATLPLYVSSFGWIASLLATFARNDSGYAGFTIARYGLCLAIMLPATFCAGMTLPLITRTLLAKGSGERAIGAVYAWNTLGSIIGVVAGGLILLPLIGLKLMLMAGAAIDMGLGILLLSRAGTPKRQSRRLVLAAAGASVVVLALVGVGVRLDANLLSSGVYVLPGGSHRDRHGCTLQALGLYLASHQRQAGRFAHAHMVPALQLDSVSCSAPGGCRSPGPPPPGDPGVCTRSRDGRHHRTGFRDILPPPAGKPGPAPARHHRDRAADDRRLAGVLSGQPADLRRSTIEHSHRRCQILLRLGAPQVRPDHVGAVESMGQRGLWSLY
jgi:hypothetical protein